MVYLRAMVDVTLGIAILLGMGLLMAKIGQRFNLPSVTGYIVAGIILGPSGFDLISAQKVGHELDHFTQIALMLIAFGIGEHIELSRLRSAAKSIGLITFFQALGTFLIVSAAIYTGAQLVDLNSGTWQSNDYVILALLLAAIGVATAPASLLHVTQELRASGPLTSTLMAVIAIDDGVAIMIFGITLSLAAQMMGAENATFAAALMTGLAEISLSLLVGIITGLLLDFILPRLKEQREMMTAGLAILLLCGEICRLFHLAPLLAGMMAGFVIINRDTRDVRLFRALNTFEPPIYILFFTLAGTHLHVSTVLQAGWIGLVYFISRIAGKVLGTYCGASLAGSSAVIRNYLGLALIPQAGVAIGLIFLIGSEPKLEMYSAIITPVVLTTVFLTELMGPVCATYAIEKAGEKRSKEERADEHTAVDTVTREYYHLRCAEAGVSPWVWDKLHPASPLKGVVAFGASNPTTLSGITRISTLLAHHYDSLPLSIRVVKPGEVSMNSNEAKLLFEPERQEAKSLGYPLRSEMIQYDDVASGLVSAVEYNSAKAVVLGFPVQGTFQGFQHILETVAAHVLCPVVVVRLCGLLKTERILVPVAEVKELNALLPILQTFSKIGEHHITVLYLLADGSTEKDGEQVSRKLVVWLKKLDINFPVCIEMVTTEARQETILSESAKHDIVMMGASRKNLLEKLFFGSLAETVAHSCQKTLLIVYRPEIDISNTSDYTI